MIRIRSFFRGISNLWRFRREVWNFSGYDYMYNLDLLEKSLIETHRSISKNTGDFEFNKDKLSQIKFCLYMVELVRSTDGEDQEQKKHLQTLFKAMEEYFHNWWY